MSCTATLTTAIVEECGYPEGCTVLRCYQRADLTRFHLELHTLTCENHPDGDPGLVLEDRRHENAYVQWYDDAPGATPHVDPAVTDAEVQAAWDEWGRDNGLPRHGKAHLRAALEAAAKVREEQA